MELLRRPQQVAAVDVPSNTASKIGLGYSSPVACFGCVAAQHDLAEKPSLVGAGCGRATALVGIHLDLATTIRFAVARVVDGGSALPRA